jgi:hypothetical protein
VAGERVWGEQRGKGCSPCGAKSAWGLGGKTRAARPRTLSSPAAHTAAQPPPGSTSLHATPQPLRGHRGAHLGGDAGAKAHVVAVDEAARIAGAVHYAEVHGVAAARTVWRRQQRRVWQRVAGRRGERLAALAGTQLAEQGLHGHWDYQWICASGRPSRGWAKDVKTQRPRRASSIKPSRYSSSHPNQTQLLVQPVASAPQATSPITHGNQGG